MEEGGSLAAASTLDPLGGPGIGADTEDAYADARTYSPRTTRRQPLGSSNRA